ncbi:FAD/NAD(P)-binding oxidoreductase [Rugosimonospora africana]|uniref:FAD/NAD(P)-binding oxidoreductase n=1 Tax=Rugosimonospora africana TaxID=556532 RepID=A0A8J3VPM4_9ACTN|nr:FAD/NAD(P)-binding oxidoreductase [Rugosimonospora africana]
MVGHGMSGARLVSELHARDPELDLTVLGAEPHPAYNRILLSAVVAGTVAEADITLVEPAAHRASTRLGTAVVDLDRAARTVWTSDGGRLRYDRLVLATGGRAVLPEIKGLVGDDGSLPDRVAPFRTLDDCRRITALASGARTALVLGGGLLGLEAARGLARRGLAVTVLHAVGHLMDRQLDAAASAVLVDSLASLGVRVELDACTVAVAPDVGRVEAVLADGRRLAGDLLVVACGIRPETDLAVRAGLAVERGVVVDDRMRTSDPRVFAIGDCAEHAGRVTGLLAPAWAQARVAADVITAARPLARYRPTAPVTRLKAAGIDLAAMGDSTRTGGDQVTYADPARGTYAKLVVRDNRLSGAIMIGDNPTVGTVIQMFDRGTPLPPDPRALLLGRWIGGPVPVGAPQASPSLMPDAAVVCQCNTVTKKDLVGCWRGGARTVGDLVAGTRASTGCGSCRDTVEGILGWLRGAEEDVA